MLIDRSTDLDTFNGTTNCLSKVRADMSNSEARIAGRCVYIHYLQAVETGTNLTTPKG